MVGVDSPREGYIDRAFFLVSLWFFLRLLPNLGLIQFGKAIVPCFFFSRNLVGISSGGVKPELSDILSGKKAEKFWR
jgi:hypothetical protein